MDATDLIEMLGLEPLLGEGGFYRETYRSADTVDKSALPDRYNADKQFCTAIYYLLTPDTVSAMHRLPTAEIFHFYLGDPVTMLQLHPDGSGDTVTLGQDILSGQLLQHVVPKGVWQGATLAGDGRFALMGVTVSPAFDFEDFEVGDRAALLADFGDYRDLIVTLTDA